MTKVMNEDLKYPEMDVLTNEELCDVVFEINGQTIRTHKQFLSVKSRVFRDQFKTNDEFTKSGQTVVPIKDTTYKAFKTFIHYLYCDELVIEDYNDLQLIANIAILSSKYEVIPLLDKISCLLKTRIYLKTELSSTDPLIELMVEINEVLIKELNKTLNYIKYPEIHYFMSESLSDVVFIIDGHRVPALKQLLNIKSRVFRSMFSGKFRESVEKEVVIKDTTFKAFKKFIHFLYFNGLPFEETDDREIYQIFKLLDRYEVLRVNKSVFNQIIINVENFTTLIEIAFHFNIENLKTNIMSFINENFDYLYRNNFEDIQDFNERTDNKLLDVLTSNKPKGFSYLGEFHSDRILILITGLSCNEGLDEMIKNESKDDSDLVYFHNLFNIISASKEIIENQCNYSLMTSNPWKGKSNCFEFNTSSEAFKAFIGYIYFKKLIFGPNDCLDQIQETFDLAKSISNRELMTEIITLLNDITITVENSVKILRFAFDNKLSIIGDLRSKVMDFIEKNVNQWISSVDHYELEQSKDIETNYRLLEVLTNNMISPDIEHVKFDINGRVMTVITKYVFYGCLLSEFTEFRVGDQEVITIEDISFEAFQTIVGFLYFNEFIFKYKIIDFELIREVCQLLERYNSTWVLNDLGSYLEYKINSSNFELICEIAFDFEIKALNEFRNIDIDYQDSFQLMFG